jgi:cytosine/adenosine deaminase-related metal-dependent hydrolase
LVWCPDSNQFLLGQTTDTTKLDEKIKIVFGTDSTLTASWNAWEHFRTAIGSGQVGEEQLLKRLTEIPARLWNFTDRGQIREGAKADLVVIRQSGDLFHTNPEDILLVLTKGIPRLADERVRGNPVIRNFSRIMINDSVKKIQGDLPALVQSVGRYYSAAKFPFSNAR